VLRCRFLDNHATNGGAVWFQGGEMNEPLFENCRFTSNSADGDGGAVYNYDRAGLDDAASGASLKFVNCIFDLNDAVTGEGGAAYGELFATNKFINCTIVRNDAATYSALYHEGNCGNEEAMNHILNSIVRFNLTTTEIGGNAYVANSAIADEDWATCVNSGGITEADPEFVNLNDGDYRLSCGSPCINGAVGALLPSDTYDLDQDGYDDEEKVPDALLQDRVFGPGPDMGAFEAQVTFLCNPPQDGDTAPLPCTDGVVNIDDLLLVIMQWGSCPAAASFCAGDIANADGEVNIDDLLLVITNWSEDCLPGSYNAGSLSSVQDCIDYCTNAIDPPYGEAWENCINNCVQALCEAEIINCD
jgi:hypothetical protein